MITEVSQVNKVTVVVPAYNVEQYVGECIESILAQTLQDLQIILIDDCSSDGTADILRSYAKKDDRISTFFFENNSGVSASRNFGLSRASGEYVQFVDSDDLVPEDAIEKLYNAAKANKADLIRGNGEYFNQGEPTKMIPMENVETVTSRHGLDYKKTNFHGHPWYHVLFLYRVEFLRSNDIQYPLLRLGEDPIFLLAALLKSARSSTIPDIVYKYRVGLTRVDHFENRNKINDYFSHLKQMKKLFSDHGLECRWVKYFNETFWWPWENYIINYREAIQDNLDSIKEIFTSLPPEFPQSLSSERFFCCCAARTGRLDYILSTGITQLNSVTAKLKSAQLELAKSKQSRPLGILAIITAIPEKLKQIRDLKLLNKSRQFDRKWYLEEYPDVKESGIDPVRHYLLFGWTEGRDPSPQFSTSRYLQENPKVAKSGQNPLIHALKQTP